MDSTAPEEAVVSPTDSRRQTRRKVRVQPRENPRTKTKLVESSSHAQQEVEKNPAEDVLKENINEPDACVICMDNLGANTGLIECGHAFCMDCIKTWAKTENTCPLCKKRFNAITRKETEETAADSASKKKKRSKKPAKIKVKTKNQRADHVHFGPPGQISYQDLARFHSALQYFAQRSAVQRLPPFMALPFSMNLIHGPLHGMYDDEDDDDDDDDDDDEGIFQMLHREIYRNQRHHEDEVIDVSDDDVPIVRLPPPLPGEVIDLTMDDDEEPAVPAPVVSSSAAACSSSSTPSRTSKRSRQER